MKVVKSTLMYYHHITFRFPTFKVAQLYHEGPLEQEDQFRITHCDPMLFSLLQPGIVSAFLVSLMWIHLQTTGQLFRQLGLHLGLSALSLWLDLSYPTLVGVSYKWCWVLSHSTRWHTGLIWPLVWPLD